jgi:hypothetical protein
LEIRRTHFGLKSPEVFDCLRNLEQLLITQGNPELTKEIQDFIEGCESEVPVGARMRN